MQADAMVLEQTLQAIEQVPAYSHNIQGSLIKAHTGPHFAEDLSPLNSAFDHAGFAATEIFQYD